MSYLGFLPEHLGARILTQILYLGGGPRKQVEMVVANFRRLVLSVVIGKGGNRCSQWDGSMFRMVLSVCSCAWKQSHLWEDVVQRKAVWAKGACGPSLLPRCPPPVEKAPVEEHGCLDPAASGAAGPGCGARADTAEGGYERVSKLLSSLLNHHWTLTLLPKSILRLF